MTSRLTREMVAEARELLRLMGVPTVQAPSEGEAQAAHMAATSDRIWAAASKDYDSLLFGAPRLVRFLTISGKEFLPSQGTFRPIVPETIVLERLLEGWGIDREALVDLAILVGTDFNDGIKGIGPKKALALVQAARTHRAHAGRHPARAGRRRDAERTCAASTCSPTSPTRSTSIRSSRMSTASSGSCVTSGSSRASASTPRSSARFATDRWGCSTTDIRRRLSIRQRVCINTPLNVSTEEVRVKEKMLAAAIAIATVSAYGVVPRAQTPAQAPSPVPPPAAKIQPGDAPGYAFDITKAEIDYVLKNAPANPPDRQLRVVDMGKYNLGVGIIRRGPTNEKPGDPVPVLWHDYTPEIYYITSGSGVLTTGGVILNQRRRPGRAEHDERSERQRHRRSRAHTAGASVPGDIIIIPNKVAHGWSGVTDHIEYLSYRPDPDRVLPAGWVYPLLLQDDADRGADARGRPRQRARPWSRARAGPVSARTLRSRAAIERDAALARVTRIEAPAARRRARRAPPASATR